MTASTVLMIVWLTSVVATMIYSGVCQARYRRAYRRIHPIPTGLTLTDLFWFAQDQRREMFSPQSDPALEQLRRRVVRSFVTYGALVFGFWIAILIFLPELKWLSSVLGL
jgi:hypothetical protein